ncbi:hypothetical protein MATL_G00176270 [Megalops atlanticus]|uniref:Uncharacterized protein n=1 Tax=Megalops atlanticus TaxID=7932 RepID=A0A9D3T606_MEGAT|nr:hypothetical protein MATL_G00176270 [Megalops atlanticus]
MDCPVEGCPKQNMAWLQLHLRRRHYLTDTHLYMEKAKLKAINKRLEAIRPAPDPDEEQTSKLQELERKIAELNRVAQTLTGDRHPAGAAMHESSEFPSPFDQLLDEYQQYCCGLTSDAKLLDNACQHAARVQKWIMFVHGRQSTPSVKLTFMSNCQLTWKWLKQLHKSNYSRLTVKAYIDAAANFLHYLGEMKPPRANSRDIQGAKKYSDTMGFLLGYIYMVTGHRRGVLTNMTVQDFGRCQSSPTGGYLVPVASHKTSAKFGRASLPLRKEELSWFLAFSAHRSRLPGYAEKPRTFFFNSSGRPLSHVGEYICRAWKSLHLPGNPTVTLIRSSVATLVSDRPEPERQRVAQAMCHDLATAERFYMADLNPAKSHESRKIVEQCLTESTPIQEAPQDSDDSGEGTSRQVHVSSAHRKRRLVFLETNVVQEGTSRESPASRTARVPLSMS